MTVYPKHKHCKSGSVDNPKAIGLADFKGERRILVECLGEILATMGIIDQSGVGHWLDTLWILGAEEFLHQDGMFLVVPVAENNSELVVVRVRFLGRVDQDRCS